MMSSPLPALPSVPPDQFYGTVEVPNATAMQVESASKRDSNADALYGPGGEKKCS